ncbi:unnamed protein product [Lactuca virosa]|uniref:Uncharacterized protein n=1 Tax=Lactuca virosa TaxID=75947 RepID=A0AAU9NXX0_9ASTR|nr:unnamed protein product [Lactuca virosa]
MLEHLRYNLNLVPIKIEGNVKRSLRDNLRHQQQLASNSSLKFQIGDDSSFQWPPTYKIMNTAVAYGFHNSTPFSPAATRRPCFKSGGFRCSMNCSNENQQMKSGETVDGCAMFWRSSRLWTLKILILIIKINVQFFYSILLTPKNASSSKQSPQGQHT